MGIQFCENTAQTLCQRLCDVRTQRPDAQRILACEAGTLYQLAAAVSVPSIQTEMLLQHWPLSLASLRAAYTVRVLHLFIVDARLADWTHPAVALHLHPPARVQNHGLSANGAVSMGTYARQAYRMGAYRSIADARYDHEKDDDVVNLYF